MHAARSRSVVEEILQRSSFLVETIAEATIAKKANAQKLLLGHFSARYRDLTPLLEEARTVFENSFLAIEGQKFVVD